MTVIASSAIQSDQSQPWQEKSSGSLGSHCLAQLVQSAQVSQVICVLRNSLSHSPFVSPEAYRNQLQEKKLFSSPVIPRTKASIENSSALSPMLCTPSGPWTFVPVRYRSVASCSSSAIYLPWLSFIAAVVQRGLTPAHAGELILEASVATQESATGLGYADGRIVCEKILELAAVTYSDELEIAIVRGGPIVGSRATGIWITKEVVPVMLRSSLSLRKLPRLRGARSDLLDTVGPVLGLTRRIPFDKWLAAVVEAAETEGTTHRYPALKLKAFFARLFEPAVCRHVILATGRSRACSLTLRQMQAVEDKVVLKLVQHWKDIGYFA
ncbi:uncharacterized protein An04g10100 [Aspergillus niger]|uniref:Contig An04c0370, genomic contig n=2 Tax=Aspergillus niger TaxID=5061 RepID=A2QKC3_ASPNC|nr:uncharacterized protein An04g10100 [Aspergillus niger]CAK39069.1 unnamed protein product [Aspergillus niger]